MRKRTLEENIEKKRNAFINSGFELFSKRGIQSVTLQEIADASGYGIATLYRYFENKEGLVIAIAASKWSEVILGGQHKLKEIYEKNNITAAQVFEAYLDVFLEMYRDKRDLLRFNQFFNIYVQTEKITTDMLKPYQEVIGMMTEGFDILRKKAEQDHTMRTDIPVQEIFSTSLHIMLAVVTRYAVGLVYRPEGVYDDMKELQFQKELMLKAYTV